MSQGICIFNLFPDESFPASPSLGLTLSFRSHNRETTFSYLDAVSSFLFVAHSFSPVFSLKRSCCALGQSGMEEEQRRLVSWGNQKNLLDFQNMVQAVAPSASCEQALRAALGWVHASTTEIVLPWAEALKHWWWFCKYWDSVVNCFQLIFSPFITVLLFISVPCISPYTNAHTRTPLRILEIRILFHLTLHLSNLSMATYYWKLTFNCCM